MSEPLEATAEAAVVRPGDTLVIRVDPDRMMTPEALDEFRAHIVERLADAHVRVLVLAADGMAVYGEDVDG